MRVAVLHGKFVWYDWVGSEEWDEEDIVSRKYVTTIREKAYGARSKV
jgi:hypothetical protein